MLAVQAREVFHFYDGAPSVFCFRYFFASAELVTRGPERAQCKVVILLHRLPIRHLCIYILIPQLAAKEPAFYCLCDKRNLLLRVQACSSCGKRIAIDTTTLEYEVYHHVVVVHTGCQLRVSNSTIRPGTDWLCSTAEAMLYSFHKIDDPPSLCSHMMVPRDRFSSP